MDELTARCVEPSAEALRRINGYVRTIRPFVRAALYPWAHVTWSGTFPSDGPVLLLSNHVGFLDGIVLGVVAGRAIPILVTRSVLRSGIVGSALRTLGAVPKQKFAVDAGAVRRLSRWASLGAAVALFPEGQRSWDGTPQPILPGTERLVGWLGIPVVTARIINADRQWPRWCTRPRRSTIHVELDPPVRIDRDMPPAEVHAWITERIRVPPGAGASLPASGTSLAGGLPNLVFACPACDGIDVLEARGDRLACGRCAASWSVTTENTLDHRPIHEISGALRTRIATSGTLDPDRLARDGIVLESEPMRLLEVPGSGEPVEVARGRLVLTPEALEVRGDTPWRIPLAELRAVSVDAGRDLFLLGPERTWAAILPTESVVKWEWLTEHWRARAARPSRSRA